MIWEHNLDHGYLWTSNFQRLAFSFQRSAIGFQRSALSFQRSTINFQPFGSWQRLNLHRQDGREISNNGNPVVAGIGRAVDLAAGRAEIHAARIKGVDGHRVAEHVYVAVTLRQALGERFPVSPAGAASIDAEPSVGRIV